MTEFRLLSIQVALPSEHGTPGAARAMERPWTTAFFKAPVAGPVWLGATNLAGDAQADPKHHGGPDKAVMAYAAVHYPGWRAELYLEIPHGGFGENFTVGGMDEATVCLGDTYEVGGAVVQVTQPRIPCWKIARRWQVKDLSARVQRSGWTGWYLRVLREGEVAAGDELTLLDRPHPEWTVAGANEAMFVVRTRDSVLALADCPALAPSLADVLRQRAALSRDSGDEGRLVGDNGE